MKTAATFFGFFIKFQSSLHVFIKAVQNNPNISFSASLAELRSDANAFTKFQKENSKKIEELTDTTFKCLSDIMKNMIGFKTFEAAKKQEKEQWSEYLKKLEKYRNAEKQFYDEKYKLGMELAALEGQYASTNFHISFLKDFMQNQETALKKAQTQVDELMKMKQNAKNYETITVPK